MGVCWRLEGFDWDSYDSFGNLECRPSGAKLFCGWSIGNDIKQFFEAQNVNSRREVNTDWLSVGHVDEVISFTPSGCAVVADPNICWALLMWADSLLINGYHSATVNGLIVYYAILTGTNPNFRAYNFDTVLAPSRLPSIRRDLGLASPVTVTTRYSGNGELSNAGAFIGFLNTAMEYKIEFIDQDKYELWYREAGTPGWTTYETSAYSYVYGDTGDEAYEDADYIFKNANCFILRHWLNGPFQTGDTFEFEADPTCSTIEMPVLFYERSAGKALARTINHVNCLVDGGTVFTGQTHEQFTNDILKNYVASMFQKAGYSIIKEADSTYYHDGGGDIHCGTNVMR